MLKKGIVLLLAVLCGMNLFACRILSSPEKPVIEEITCTITDTAADTTDGQDGQDSDIGTEPVHPAEEDAAADTAEISSEPENDGDIQKKTVGTCGITDIQNEKALTALGTLSDYIEALDASVYYISDESDVMFSFREDNVYNTQSTIKAPYCYAIMEQYDSVEALENEHLILKQECLTDGSASFKGRYAGAYFTLKELITYAVREGDNSAYAMLFDAYGAGIFNRKAEELGISFRLNTQRFDTCTVKDMAVLYRWIWETESPLRDFLVDCMSSTTADFLVSVAVPDKQVAHKYGLSDEEGDLHDCAIVFGEHPYLVIICSKYDPDADAPYENVRQLARLTDAVNDALYS